MCIEQYNYTHIAYYIHYKMESIPVHFIAETNCNLLFLKN